MAGATAITVTLKPLNKSVKIEGHFDCQETEIDEGMQLHASQVGQYSISLAEPLWVPALH